MFQRTVYSQFVISYHLFMLQVSVEWYYGQCTEQKNTALLLRAVPRARNQLVMKIRVLTIRFRCDSEMDSQSNISKKYAIPTAINSVLVQRNIRIWRCILPFPFNYPHRTVSKRLHQRGETILRTFRFILCITSHCFNFCSSTTWCSTT